MPEEVNRIVTDSLADLLLTPSADANENLRREGVSDSKIRLVGNIMIDTLIANLEKARKTRILDKLNLKKESFVYVTLHELMHIANDWRVVFPMHPRTRKRCYEFGIPLDEVKGLCVMDPVGYHESLSLTESARFVLTDSGGLQEESTFFRTPCLTLRPNTERPITVTLGSNRLTQLHRLGADIEGVSQGVSRTGSVPPLWDGRTADRTLQQILQASAK